MDLNPEKLSEVEQAAAGWKSSATTSSASADGSEVIAWQAADLQGDLSSSIWTIEVRHHLARSMQGLVENGLIDDEAFFGFASTNLDQAEVGTPEGAEKIGDAYTVSNRKILDAYESQFLDKKDQALYDLAGEIAAHLYGTLEDGNDVFIVQTFPNWFHENAI